VNGLNGWFVFIGLMAVSCSMSTSLDRVASAIRDQSAACVCGKGTP